MSSYDPCEKVCTGPARHVPCCMAASFAVHGIPCCQLVKVMHFAITTACCSMVIFCHVCHILTHTPGTAQRDTRYACRFYTRTSACTTLMPASSERYVHGLILVWWHPVYPCIVTLLLSHTILDRFTITAWWAHPGCSETGASMPCSFSVAVHRSSCVNAESHGRIWRRVCDLGKYHWQDSDLDSICRGSIQGVQHRGSLLSCSVAVLSGSCHAVRKGQS